MKIQLIFVALGLLIACNSREPNAEEEKKAIIAMTTARFERMLAADNPAEVARIYTENTVDQPVYMPQNNKILVGRQEIIDWATDFFGKYKLTSGAPADLYDAWIIDDLIAVHTYVSQGYFIERATGDSIYTDQKSTDVFKKEKGEWLYASHMWNVSDPEIKMFNPVCKPEEENVSSTDRK